MPAFDDRLTRELERAARPGIATGTFERVDRRRARRARIRKVGSGALAVAVLAGTLGGAAILTRAFEGDPVPDTAASDVTEPNVTVPGASSRSGPRIAPNTWNIVS